ncbi:MAG: DinB family protein, partial [Asticcacaulis sp.]
MWMTRLNRHPTGDILSPVRDLPKPAALNDRLYADYASYAPARRTLDALFITYIETLSESDLGSALRYNRANGDAHIKPLGLTLSHVFNHQTHHRGQITTLLSQMGLDIGATDVHLLVPELDTDTQ